MPIRAALAAAAIALYVGAVQAQTGRAGCDLPNADTSVHGIALGDAESTVRVLGRDFRTVVDNPASDFAWHIFASRDNKQLLLLRHHAGGTLNSYMEFEVKFGRHDRHPMQLPVYEFVSGQGLKLNLRRRAVVRKLGPCFKSTVKGDTEIVRYEVEDETSALPVLKGSGAQHYYAEYEFRKGVLVRFRFGHDPV